MPKGKHNNHAPVSAAGNYRHGEVQHINGKRVATPEYNTWQLMKNRCLNPLSQDWAYYGGRGITIDPRWLDYLTFLADMGRRTTPKHTLDRKDNDGNYCKENCHWATRQHQSRNRACVYLSLEKAREIRTAYAKGGITQTDLAVQYGTTQVAISQIVRGVSWVEEVEQ